MGWVWLTLHVHAKKLPARTWTSATIQIHCSAAMKQENYKSTERKKPQYFRNATNSSGELCAHRVVCWEGPGAIREAPDECDKCDLPEKGMRIDLFSADKIKKWSWNL